MKDHFPTIIDDMQAWSDYVSEHVEEIANNRFRLSLPDGPLQKRATK
jgi:3-methyladenine DNA glycosylase AlkC